jgi:phosphoglycerate dehydrogenase-like enzyme
LQTRWNILKWYPDTDDRAALLELLPQVNVLVGGDVLGGWPLGLKLGMYQIPYTGCEWASADRLPAGCQLCNTYEHETAIAEYVLLNLLEWEIGMVASDRSFRERGWDVGWPSHDGHGEIRGKTVGIVGYGHIGREVAARCAAFGTRVIGVARNPRATPLELDWLGVCTDAQSADLHTLYEQSDYVIVSCLLSDTTRGLIDADGFRRMRSHAVVINVARGPVIDEQALYKALKDKDIRGASIDVWYNYPQSRSASAKPNPSNLPLFELDNIRVSAHDSGSTKETTERRWESVIDNLNRFARGDEVRNVVLTGTGAQL